MLCGLAACNPTKGSDPNAFRVQPTNNTDFTQTVINVGVQPLSAAIAPRGVGICGDFHDQAPNAAVANYIDSTISYLTNDGAGNFTVQSVPTGFAPTRLLFADLDGSNAAKGNCSWDLIAMLEGNLAGNGNGVTILTTKDNTNWTSTTLVQPVPPVQVALGDMNHDGFQDVIVSFPGESAVLVFLNDGAGAFSFASTISIALNVVPTRFIVSDYFGAPLDFDGDACPDLAVLVPAFNQVYVLYSKNNGVACAPFTPGGTYGIGIVPVDINPVDLAAADIDGSNGTDLLVLTAGTPRLDVKLNQGTLPATFADLPGTPLAVRNGPYRMLLGTFSGAQLGIAMVHPADKSMGLVTAVGGGGLVSSAVQVLDDPFDLAAGHFTVSGHLDLAIPEDHRRMLYIAQGDGAGNFDMTQFGFTNIPGPPAVARLRPGTADDILITHKNANTVRVLKNIHP